LEKPEGKKQTDRDIDGVQWQDFVNIVMDPMKAGNLRFRVNLDFIFFLKMWASEK
jgi:hypothetical protein